MPISSVSVICSDHQFSRIDVRLLSASGFRPDHVEISQDIIAATLPLDDIPALIAALKAVSQAARGSDD